jgi:hypothetical protein
MNIKGHYGPIAFQSLRFHTFPSSFLIETMHSVYHGDFISFFYVFSSLCFRYYIVTVEFVDETGL